jgi:hypothetical protein
MSGKHNKHGEENHNLSVKKRTRFIFERKNGIRPVFHAKSPPGSKQANASCDPKTGKRMP